jgi:hypothetical protein
MNGCSFEQGNEIQTALVPKKKKIIFYLFILDEHAMASWHFKIEETGVLYASFFALLFYI